MSRVISFSTDDEFANSIDDLVIKSGYKNRSRFIRDASMFFAEKQQRGELEEMADDVVVEAMLIVYYQHGIEKKLLELRHSNELDVSSYNHACLPHSHTCVDVMNAKGTAKQYRKIIKSLQNTPNVDKVTFVSAPLRDSGCC